MQFNLVSFFRIFKTYKKPSTFLIVLAVSVWNNRHPVVSHLTFALSNNAYLCTASSFNSPSILHPFLSSLSELKLSVSVSLVESIIEEVLQDLAVAQQKLVRSVWRMRTSCVLAVCARMYAICAIASHLILLISGETFKRVLPALKQQDQCPSAKSRGASVPYWRGQLGHSHHTPNLKPLYPHCGQALLMPLTLQKSYLLSMIGFSDI